MNVFTPILLYASGEKKSKPEVLVMDEDRPWE
jgi:hypothetical protein